MIVIRLNGRNPTISYFPSFFLSDDVYSNQTTNDQEQKIFGAAKPVRQDGDIRLSTFTPAKVEFIYGQDTSERFTSSAIFGNIYLNTNSVNISDEQSGNSGKGTSSDIGVGCKNLIDDATENLSTAAGGSDDIEMSDEESLTSSSIASAAEVQDIQTDKVKRPNKKTRDRMKRQIENAKGLLKLSVDNDQSRLPNDSEDTNIETGGKKTDANIEIQNKEKDGMSHTNNDDRSNKDNANKNNKENDNRSNDNKSNDNKSSKDEDNKSESKIDQKGATSSQHGNTTVQSDNGKEKKKTEASKTGDSSKKEVQKTDKKHSSGNEESKKNRSGKSKNQPEIKKNKNEANNSSKDSQPNSSEKTNDKGNACPTNKPQVLLEKSH